MEGGGPICPPDWHPLPPRHKKPPTKTVDNAATERMRPIETILVRIWTYLPWGHADPITQSHRIDSTPPFDSTGVVGHFKHDRAWRS